MESLPSPTTLPSIPHPDWISCVRAHHTDNDHSYIFTTCYDGIVRVYNNEQMLQKQNNNNNSIDTDQSLCEGIGHISSIKHIAVQPSTINNHNLAVTVSKDRTSRIWQLNNEYKKCIQIGQIDTDAVQECCAVLGNTVCMSRLVYMFYMMIKSLHVSQNYIVDYTDQTLQSF